MNHGTPVGAFERAFVVLALVLYSGGFLGLLSEDGQTETPGLRFVWLPIYLITAAILLPRLAQVRQLLFASWPLLALVGLCGISAIWSIDPGVTVRRVVAVGATTLLGVYLAARYDDLGRLRMLAWCFCLIALSSLAFAVAIPRVGVTSEIHVGAWRGIFPQKNALGQVMVYGSAVLMVLTLVDPVHRRKTLAGLLLCIALVLLSTSVTSLIGLVLVLALTAAVTLLFRHPGLAVLAIYVSVLGAVGLTIALLTDPAAVFDLFGRDPTLTGRTDIWEPLWEMVRDRFWLGYGYGVFWEDPEGPAWYVRRAVQWNVPSAHNGWVELWLDVGLVGLAIFMAMFIVAVYRTVSRLRIGVADVSLWPLLLLSLFLVFSFSESSILRHNDLVWVMYVATISAYGFRAVRGREPVPYYPGMANAPGAAPPPSFWR